MGAQIAFRRGQEKSIISRRWPQEAIDQDGSWCKFLIVFGWIVLVLAMWGVDEAEAAVQWQQQLHQQQLRIDMKQQMQQQRVSPQEEAGMHARDQAANGSGSGVCRDGAKPGSNVAGGGGGSKAMYANTEQ